MEKSHDELNIRADQLISFDLVGVKESYPININPDSILPNNPMNYLGNVSIPDYVRILPTYTAVKDNIE